MSFLVAVRLTTRRLPSCGERRAGPACLTTSFPCWLLLNRPSSPHPGDTGRVCFASRSYCHRFPPITFLHAPIHACGPRTGCSVMTEGVHTPESAYNLKHLKKGTVFVPNLLRPCFLAVICCIVCQGDRSKQGKFTIYFAFLSFQTYLS